MRERVRIPFVTERASALEIDGTCGRIREASTLVSRLRSANSQNVALNDWDTSGEGREIMMIQERLNHGDDAWYALVLGT